MLCISLFGDQTDGRLEQYLLIYLDMMAWGSWRKVILTLSTECVNRAFLVSGTCQLMKWQNIYNKHELQRGDCILEPWIEFGKCLIKARNSVS